MFFQNGHSNTPHLIYSSYNVFWYSFHWQVESVSNKKECVNYIMWLPRIGHKKEIQLSPYFLKYSHGSPVLSSLLNLRPPYCEETQTSPGKKTMYVEILRLYEKNKILGQPQAVLKPCYFNSIATIWLKPWISNARVSTS